MKNKIALAVALAAALGVSGCGQMARTQAHWMGHTKECVDGVSYLQFPSGASVQYDHDGHVVPC